MFQLLLSAVVAFSAHQAFAGDASFVKPVGFSQKGSYYAYVEAGSHDGSGAAYANAYIMSVKYNKVVESASYVEDEGGEFEFTGDADKAVAIVLKKLPLKKYAISAGKNMGEDLVLRLPTDKTNYMDTVFAVSGDIEGGASPIYRRYSLLIEETDAPAHPEYDFCKELTGRTLLKLTLKGEDKGSGELVKTMQNDTDLPADIFCAANYSVRRVTSYKDGLVVILSYLAPGFEGPDLRHRVITVKQALEH